MSNTAIDQYKANQTAIASLQQTNRELLGSITREMKPHGKGTVLKPNFGNANGVFWRVKRFKVNPETLQGETTLVRCRKKGGELRRSYPAMTVVGDDINRYDKVD